MAAGRQWDDAPFCASFASAASRHPTRRVAHPHPLPCRAARRRARTSTARRHPERFVLPGFSARHGGFGLRPDAPAVEGRNVENALLASWRLAAAKTLARKLDRQASR